MFEFEWVTLHSNFDIPKEVRTKVFMEEQGFQNEFDEIDEKSFHLAVSCEGRPAACLRLFRGENDDFIIGRIAVSPEFRGTGLGRHCVLEAEKMAATLGGKYTLLSAQCRASGFYEKLGYIPFGSEYMDEQVPHIDMRKTLPAADYEIRWLSPGDDLADSLQVRREVFTEEYGCVVDPDEFDDVSHNLVIYHGGQPVCSGRVYMPDARRAKLSKIAVLRQMRKSGMGRVIMYNLFFKAAELGAQQAELAALTSAKGFYETMGMRACSEEYNVKGRVHVDMMSKI